ncbi:hypothetical protein GPALN_007895 [Globodera pallida]|nr:hypothetical protein GPALN_007895 [Globodera pallida]
MPVGDGRKDFYNLSICVPIMNDEDNKQRHFASRPYGIDKARFSLVQKEREKGAANPEGRPMAEKDRNAMREVRDGKEELNERNGIGGWHKKVPNALKKRGGGSGWRHFLPPIFKFCNLRAAFSTKING